ncbi:hypothetical protein [Streptomyces antimycoticus]|uniref:hypothetical protein n=1 Tax=Streptomyces antimycoticus TaxID=68175 RepID=UPI003682BB5A
MKENMPRVGNPHGMLRGSEGSDREAAIDAERERRRAQQARRDSAAAAGGAPVDGFVLRKWRRAGVFGASSVQRMEEAIRMLLEQVDEDSVSSNAIRTLRSALGGEPSSDVPGAVKSLLEEADEETTVEVLICAHTARALWLAEWGASRMAVLFPEEGYPPVPPSVDGLNNGNSSAAYELFVCLAAGKAAAFPVRRLARVLSWVPVGLLDDLIDAGVVGPAEEPWSVRADEEEALYLKARLVPDQLSAAQYERVGWVERLQRDRFLAGEDLLDAEDGDLYELLDRIANGDTSVLKALEQKLPRDLVLRLRRIQDGAQIGSWEKDIIEDRGLWRLIASLWEPKAAIDPRRSPLHAVMALRQAYDLICAGNARKAAAQVAKLIAHEEASASFVAEAWNMQAYLALQSEDLDRATEALAIISLGSAELAANSALVQRRRQIPRNDRQPASNPYLELGVPHHSQYWNERYRDLRRDYAPDRDAAARVNRAAYRIRQAEQEEDWSDFFVLPLDRGVYELPYAVPASLVPPAAPMKRRTVPRSQTDLDAVRRRAVLDVLPALLTTPRRPDRHTRNSP